MAIEGLLEVSDYTVVVAEDFEGNRRVLVLLGERHGVELNLATARSLGYHLLEMVEAAEVEPVEETWN